jgi:hypothetical protein
MKKSTLLKSVIMLIILATVSFSCKKDSKAALTASGKWTKTFYISGDQYIGTMNLVQHDNNTLTGDFVFNDGSGYTQLLSTSLISGSYVTIEWMLESYKLSFTGTLNSAFNTMNGNYSANGANMGSWFATKVSKKSAITNNGVTNDSQKESLLKLLGR